VQDEEVSFDVFEAMKHPIDQKNCFRMDALDELYLENHREIFIDDSLMKAVLLIMKIAKTGRRRKSRNVCQSWERQKKFNKGFLMN